VDAFSKAVENDSGLPPLDFESWEKQAALTLASQTVVILCKEPKLNR
jgi:hypothetical protein